MDFKTISAKPLHVDSQSLKESVEERTVSLLHFAQSLTGSSLLSSPLHFLFEQRNKNPVTENSMNSISLNGKRLILQCV
jgi:hypothetical protein